MLSSILKWWLSPPARDRRVQYTNFSARTSMVAALIAVQVLFVTSLFAQKAAPNESLPNEPVIVQPGAPGEPSKRLPSSTTGKLPPLAKADVEFMQGMIMHHAQAVEMTAMISSRTDNKALRALGARISRSQTDEIKFMKRWLQARGESISMPMPEMHDVHMAHHEMPMPMMPGMLTPAQMDALRKAKGAQFDELFLTGMIQHHNGALTMVKDLFDTPGAGQDAELFDFATDADNTQRVEIKIMQEMLEKKTPEEKQ